MIPTLRGVASRSHRAWGAGGLLVVAVALAGCAAFASRSTEPTPEVAAERARAAQVQEAYQRLDAAHRNLQRENQRLVAETQRLQRERQALQETAKREAAGAVSEEEVARLRLQLLERDAQLKLLGQKLDAAILEVVRALAKLRSLESKAEAATSLAEAEIAVKMTERSAAGREKDRNAAQAENLLKLGAQEFRKNNYSGALYLSSQAKSLLKEGQPGPAGSERASRLEGEIPFALPLPLRLVGRGDAREGPGPNFKVAFSLADGAAVVAESYRGMWLKIRTDDGRSGWVRYNLVGQPR